VLVLNVADNPREFMIDYIQSLKDSREEETTDAPNLFNETNIRTAFGMFDVTNRGYITRNQYIEGAQCSVA
jgi:Ca2+-binding EF-hand superfamily protein